MPRDRVVTAERQEEDRTESQSGGPALRPVQMDEYTGQAELVERLSKVKEGGLVCDGMMVSALWLLAIVLL